MGNLNLDSAISGYSLLMLFFVLRIFSDDWRLSCKFHLCLNSIPLDGEEWANWAIVEASLLMKYFYAIIKKNYKIRQASKFTKKKHWTWSERKTQLRIVGCCCRRNIWNKKKMLKETKASSFFIFLFLFDAHHTPFIGAVAIISSSSIRRSDREFLHSFPSSGTFPFHFFSLLSSFPAVWCVCNFNLHPQSS